MTPQDAKSPLDEYFQALKEAQPERDPLSGARGRAAFLAQLDQRQNEEKAGWFTKIQETFASLSFQPSRRWTAVAASVLLALILTFGAVGGTVYASQDSLPNQALYGVKIFAEDVRLSLANQPQEKISLLEKFSQRRIEELQGSSEQGYELPQQTLLRLEQHTETMFELAAEQDEQDISQSLRQIRSMLQVHEESINQLKNKQNGNAAQALSRVQERLITKIQYAERGIENPTDFRNGKLDSTPHTPQDTVTPPRPVDTATPEDKGKPEDVGTPQNKGKPEDAGTPENKGKPEDAAPPQDKGKPDDPGKPSNPGEPDNPGPPDGRP